MLLPHGAVIQIFLLLRAAGAEAHVRLPLRRAVGGVTSDAATPVITKLLMLQLLLVHHIRSNRQGRPKNVGVAVKIESRAKVSYKGGHILKLSDKVTMTRAFTARKKNRPAILFFHRASAI